MSCVLSSSEVGGSAKSTECGHPFLLKYLAAQGLGSGEPAARGRQSRQGAQGTWASAKVGITSLASGCFPPAHFLPWDFPLQHVL